MTDLATLGIRVEGQEVVAADAQLDGLAAAAGKAETATERLAAAARGNGAAMMTMNTAVRQQSAVLGAARNSMGLTATEGLNLSRQLSDVGVTAAMGMSPLMIMIQQGPQIFGVFEEAAVRTGTTVGAVMRGVAASIWTAMAPLLPFIAAAAAAAAVIGGTLALSTRSLNREFGDLTRGMGLTEDQLEKVKDKGVTMGDVLGGTLAYLGDIIWDKVGPAVTAIGDWFTKAMDVATRALISTTKAITGGFIGAYRVVRETWSMLPAGLGDIAVTTANNVVRTVVEMLNRSRALINAFIVGSNAVSAGADLPLLGALSAPEIGNRFAGAGRALGSTAGNAFAGGMAEGTAIVDRQLAALGASIRDQAQSRIRRQAGDTDDDSGGGDGAARRARAVREELTRIEKIDLLPLRGAFIELVDPLKLVADEMRLIDGLARDTAAGLASAFGESGRALGDLLTTMSGYQARMADINLAEREYRLSATQAERERSQAQIQNYGDMASAARGFFEEGSTGYRVLLAIEQAYRIQQMIGMMQSIAMGGTETAASVANSATRGAASMAAGAAKMFEALGPWAFPAVAAMLGLLAGLGLRGGGGSGSGVPSAGSSSADASTAAARVQTDRQGLAQAGGLGSQRVQVVVTADREGMNAYVVGTAERVAAPMAIQSGRVAAQVGQARTEASLSRRQAYTVRG